MFTELKRAEYLCAIARKIYGPRVAESDAALAAAVDAELSQEKRDARKWLESVPAERRKFIITAKSIEVAADSDTLRNTHDFRLLNGCAVLSKLKELLDTKTGQPLVRAKRIFVDCPSTPTDDRYGRSITVVARAGGQIEAALKERDKLWADFASFWEEMWAVLSLARTEAQLLKSWPDAYEYLPSECKQPKGSRELVVIASHAKKRLKEIKHATQESK